MRIRLHLLLFRAAADGAFLAVRDAIPTKQEEKAENKKKKEKRGDPFFLMKN
jgi:hypothetical protein